jgi:hydroxymethylbilane synthase
LKQIIKIGTRDSQLAAWQATLVQTQLHENSTNSKLVYIKSEGDIDTVTPLYELGVQGIFTRSLDIALLDKRVDVAVHSLKDVPTKLAEGLTMAAVLKRASYLDILVFKGNISFLDDFKSIATIATSSTRRKAQWLNRYPNHLLENLRGNVNTRLRKVKENKWNGAIFAAAGLERINLRPDNSIDLQWMLPAPSQGAIAIVCRNNDTRSIEACRVLNDESTALCTKIERDFLRTLMGGCSTPISALATKKDDVVSFKGNIASPDGKILINIEKEASLNSAPDLGVLAGQELLQKEAAKSILNSIRNEQ